MAQYALDRVLSVAGTYAATNSQKNIVAGDVAFLCDQITDPSLSFTAETEDIVDARNNVVMVLENGRGATFGASNAFFNTQLLAAQTGGKVNNIDGTDYYEFTKYDIITAKKAGELELSANPTSVEKANVKVYALEKDNSLTAATVIEGTSTATLGTPAVYEKGVLKTAAVPAKVANTNVVAGERYLVTYTAKLIKGERITALADASNELMNITAEVLLRELCDEELYYAYIIMKGKLSGESEWAMSRDSQHAFEVRCMPSYCEDPRKLVEVVIVKGEELLG